ncbi:hypothetical protein [Dactylosporangium sp. CS-033363]|uniref:hypothetical protein n=1 Tax=Dactylosporangium sp. CS-033363 TaxID=3239935 RepID=UPI003D8B73F1
MSDSFLVAGRLPMSRESFEQWLDAPLPGEPAIANPAAMFTGWYWDGQDAPGNWSAAARGRTVRGWLADRVEAACTGPSGTVLRHRDGALEVYLFDLGYWAPGVQAALLALAAARPSAESLVLFWSETSGSLWKPDGDGWLSALSVDESGARFVAGRDLTATVAGLRPVEAEFFAMAERIAEDEERWDPRTQPEFRTEIPMEYVDDRGVATRGERADE